MKPYNSSAPIALVLADVDGTLVTRDKVLTERTQDAVRRLRESGIRFAVTSGRPSSGHEDGERCAPSRHAYRRL